MKGYTQAIDDCLRVLERIYEQKHDGHYYNKEVKDALEELKTISLKEVDMVSGPLMNIYTLLGRAKVSPEIVDRVIYEFNRYKEQADNDAMYDSLRAEIAKTMLPTTATMKLTKGDVSRMLPVESAAKVAVEYADALIVELKKR